MSICPLVDADYVGALLGVSRARVYQLVRENRIPFIRISERRVKFDTRQLDEFVRQGGALKQEPGTLRGGCGPGRQPLRRNEAQQRRWELLPHVLRRIQRCKAAKVKTA